MTELKISTTSRSGKVFWLAAQTEEERAKDPVCGGCAVGPAVCMDVIESDACISQSFVSEGGAFIWKAFQ